MVSAEFLITAFVVVIAPGTGVVFTVSAALSRGIRAGIVASIGCTLGIVPHLVAAALGLTAILHMSATTFQIIRYAGVAYLLYLAYKMWRQAGELTIHASASNEHIGRTVGRAVLVNLLNPKLTLFFLAFLPQFLPSEAANVIPSLSLLSSVFMGMTLIVFSGYALLAAGARRLLAESRRAATWIQRSFAGVLAALAARLAFDSD